MKSEELKKILAQHVLWLNSNRGEMANLREADLREADLRRAILQGADLRRAILQGADLRGADLRGADLDFASFPLWCGGSRFKCDQDLVYQLLAHICTLDFDDPDGIKELVLPFAIKSHRAKDLGLIGDEKARGEE